MFLRHFLYSSLVNLPLLANLEERFTHRELDCFPGVGNDYLEGDDLVDKAIEDIFALFWKIMALLAEEALPYFWK